MSARSRRQLTIQALTVSSVLFATIGAFVFAQSQKAIWLQAMATVAFVVAGIFGVRIGWQQKKCTEQMTPALKQLCKRVAVTWALIITGVLFILAVRTNTPQAWFIFAIFSASAFAGAFWERPSRQT